MKRLLTVLVVALLMVALLAATAAPMFAAPVKKVAQGKIFLKPGQKSPPFIGGKKHSPPPND